MNKRSVVVTGWGLISPIGNDITTVTAALKQGKSGITFIPEYAELGFSCHLAGVPVIEHLEPIPRKYDRFMGNAARYGYHAMRAAITSAHLEPSFIQHERTGLIVGSGVGSPYEHMLAVELMKERGIRKVPPYIVPRVMGNTVSANLVDCFGIMGLSYGLTSACATGAHCIGHAAELIANGKLDRAFAGAAEETSWTSTFPFDAMGALSSHSNDSPQQASRPFDQSRDGFVIAGGAGILVLEALESAQARGVPIYAQIVGYGASSSGASMVALDKAGAKRAMQLALQGVNGQIDYINAHATSTPQGDAVEVEAIAEVFAGAMPIVSSTKGLTGHAIAASGAHELIYSLIMMQDDFIAPNYNLDKFDAMFDKTPFITELKSAKLNCIMSNSFGFGGTYASIVLQKISPT